MLHRIPVKSNGSTRAQRVRYVIGMASYVFDFRVPFDDADPAGISFFANVYRYHHQAYEAWVVEALGVSYPEWFLSKSFGVPLRKTEAEHTTPLFPGEKYESTLTLEEIGQSSFVLSSTITPKGKHDRVCAKVRTVHVFIDVHGKGKLDIPTHIRERMAKLAKA